MTNIDLKVLPRERMVLGWEEFVKETPPGSIALDGAVSGGPQFSEQTGHLNCDHHDNCLREATMSTARQVLFRIKGGTMDFRGKPVHVYVNDCDQDVSLAAWELENYKLIHRTHSNPVINRLIDISDKLDITGGGFPMDLDDRFMRQYNWIFQPYNVIRKSGRLACASPEEIRETIELVGARITRHMLGSSGEVEPDMRHKVLYSSPSGYRIIDEIGGTDARLYLFSQGLDAFISIVATRPDGRRVVTVGKRSEEVPFPVERIYDRFNEAEGRTRKNGFNGSNIIGGSSRTDGTGLGIDEMARLADEACEEYRKVRRY